MITCAFLLAILCLLMIFTIAIGIFEIMLKLLWYLIPVLAVVMVIAVIVSLFKT